MEDCSVKIGTTSEINNLEISLCERQNPPLHFKPTKVIGSRSCLSNKYIKLPLR